MLEGWVRQHSLESVLGPLIPTPADRLSVLQLLYQYRHLNGEDFTNLPCTDLITHRVCITPGTKPFSARFQKRWPPHTEWWMRKLVHDGLLGGVYELTEPANGRLSQWNARAVMVDKSEDPRPEDEPRMTFDYSRVHEDLPGTYVELSSKVHDHLSNPSHGSLFKADLKHAYLTVPLHPDDRQYFAFTISGIGQCQPTRMQPGSKSAGFTMTAAVYKGFGFIPPPQQEPSLLHSDDPSVPPPLSFYTDDFFGGFRDFQAQFLFLRDHFFPRVEWARMVLSFKKLRLFADSIEALGVRHCVGGHVYIRDGRIAKIATFPVPSDQSGVRAFLGVIGITRRWVKNFAELARPLNRLTGKVDWRWTEQEQLSFEILRIKCATTTSIHGLDLSSTCHLYTDASLHGAGLCITQFRSPEEAFCNGTRLIEVPIAYDSFAFSPTQKLYPTYKKELCAIVKFCVKYDYLCKHPYNTAIVHTDHRPLVHFMKSDLHEGIYGHWADLLRRLNIEIQYIPGPRNKVADGLSRTLFHTDMKDSSVEACSRRLAEQGPCWIWKDGKDGFEAFLKGLDGVTRTEVIDEGTAHGVSVFRVQAMASQAGKDWSSAYHASDWFRDLYLIHTTDDVDSSMTPRVTQALDYRVDTSTGVLWKHHRGAWLPCVPESRVLSVLRMVHDQAGHWGKAGTLAKLRGYAYWPDQSQDVERYIAGCLECARHGPAMRSQLLHLVIVLGPFRLLGIDFIGPLPCSGLGNFYILHLICYFSRFSITSPSKTANATDVIPALQQAFTAYAKPKAVYWDRGQHYDNQLVKDFLDSLGVAFSFSPSGLSQSTGMVEVGNKILEDVIRKGGDWEDNLQTSTRSTNSRTIGHLAAAPCEILLGVPPSPDLSELWKPSAANDSVRSFVIALSNPIEHSRLVQQYISYRSELHDQVAQRSIARKEQEAIKFNRGVRHNTVFANKDLVMLHQKASGKLQPRWRGPFRVEGFGSDRQLSYVLRQLNGRLIRGTFHGNHLKRFNPRTGYLSTPTDPQLPQQQTIRRRPRRVRLFLRPPKPPSD